MARSASVPRRKPRLRTELSEADEQRLQEAVALFGLPKAEVVRRLIRASVQAGPALSAARPPAFPTATRRTERPRRGRIRPHQTRASPWDSAAPVPGNNPAPAETPQTRRSPPPAASRSATTADPGISTDRTSPALCWRKSPTPGRTAPSGNCAASDPPTSSAPPQTPLPQTASGTRPPATWPPLGGNQTRDTGEKLPQGPASADRRPTPPPRADARSPWNSTSQTLHQHTHRPDTPDA